MGEGRSAAAPQRSERRIVVFFLALVKFPQIIVFREIIAIQRNYSIFIAAASMQDSHSKYIFIATVVRGLFRFRS